MQIRGLSSLRAQRRAGFTLVELAIVMIVLGILSAVAIPRFFDFTSDAKQSAAKGVLGGVRSGIANFYAHSGTASGGGVSAFPTLLELTTPGSVMAQAIADNPYSTGAVKNAVVAGKVKGTPETPGTTGGWCYDSTSGHFWADTASGAGEAGF